MKGRAITATVAIATAGALSAPAAGLARPVLAGTPAVAASAAVAPAPAPAPAPPTLARCRRVANVACYTPAQLHRAYGLPALYARGLSGQGSTVVIVDPFGSPTIAHDLSVFDRAFGLPAPPRLRIIRPAGRVPPFDPSNPDMLEKAGETTLDVEWSHAIAPKAKIVLAETPAMEQADTQGFAQYMTAERFVVNHDLGDVISQSFSLPEQNFKPGQIRSLRRTYIDAEHHRVTVLAASNDNGVTGPNRAGTTLYRHRVVFWPATDPLVTAVGGTVLHLDTAGRRTSPDTVWNDTHSAAVSAFSHTPNPFPWASAGGLSRVFARPAYQRSVRAIVGNRRGVPDVSMSAALSGSVLSYASYPGGPGGWIFSGGTSEATPEFAGVVALADQYARTRLHHRRLGLVNPALYRLEARHAPGIVDVTRGDNTVAFPGKSGTVTVRGYRARRGYDLTTGVGTINAARFVPELARAG